MVFARVNALGWALFETLSSAQMNALDVNMTRALDGYAGGTYNPSSFITWNNAWVVNAAAGPGTNVIGVNATGKGNAPGVIGTGGANSGIGVAGAGGATDGIGVRGVGAGGAAGVDGVGGGTNGPGVKGTGGASAADGVQGYGTGSGSGVYALGAAGPGVTAQGGVLGAGGGATGVDGTGGNATGGIGGAGGAFTAGTGSVGANGGTGVVATGGAPGAGGVGGFGLVATGGSTGGFGVDGIGTGAGAVGVRGRADSGRGGYFQGDTAGSPVYAAVRIVPQSGTPSILSDGDVFITSDEMWCRLAGETVGISFLKAHGTFTTDGAGGIFIVGARNVSGVSLNGNYARITFSDPMANVTYTAIACSTEAGQARYNATINAKNANYVEIAIHDTYGTGGLQNLATLATQFDLAVWGTIA